MASVIESIESRSIGTSGGRGQGLRVWHAEGYTGISDVYGLIGGSLPAKGDSHPDFPGLIAKDFAIQKVAGHGDLWKVQWQYEVISTEFNQSPVFTPQTLPNEVNYVEISAEIRAEFFEAWRADPTIPAGGNPSEGVDIGGDKIDAAGVPTSLQRNIQELTVTETVNEPKLDTYRSFRFTRNSSAFFGSPAGTLLYRGASIRRTGVSVYQVAHSFVEDEYMHLQQEPLIEPPDMTPKLVEGKADQVYWVQPFPNKTNFNSLSSNF